MIEWIKANIMLVKLLACALMLATAFLFGWRQGSLNVQSAWDKEKAELNAQAIDKIAQANDRVRQVEAEAARQVAAVDAQYQQQLRRNENEKAIALRRASTGGLFINAKCPSSGDSLPTAAASTSRSDAGSRVELPRSDAEFLITFAAEADQVADQLRACQGLLK